MAPLGLTHAQYSALASLRVDGHVATPDDACAAVESLRSEA